MEPSTRIQLIGKMIFGQSQFTGSPNVDSYCQMAIWSLLKLTTPREVQTRFFRT